MTLHTKLFDMFEEEVNERVSTLLGEYAETISRKHAVPLDILLRDLPVVAKVSLCKGTKSNGQAHKEPCTTPKRNGNGKG